jgi:cytosine/adenosine deaminase-related metal-dependent hydrolase
MSQKDIIVHAGRMVTGYDQAPLANGAVLVSGEIIRQVGTFDEIKAQNPEAEVIGGPGFLLIPGLINAHAHGRGLSDFQRGALDNTLESWTYDTLKFKPVPTYEDVSLAAACLLKSGVTTTMHNHNPMLRDFQADYDEALRAYRDAGIRVQFNPGVIDQRVVYGDNTEFYASLPEPLRMILTQPFPEDMLTVDKYIQAVKDLHRRSDGPMSKIGFGPLGPQWLEDDLLREIRRAADDLKAPIHIHMLQTIYQRG